MDRLWEILAMILPTIILGFIVGRRSLIGKLREAQVERDMARMHGRESMAREKRRYALSSVSDDELIRSVSSTGSVGSKAESNRTKKPR